ncbi:hypothetical protein [Rhodococcus wratislaviensis]|uniref:hypothetical protein n=1 Tax=Rhodococcus wratislaviensis TaxID=44752 RepID=UPI003518BE6A
MTDVLAHLTKTYPLLFTILVAGCVSAVVIAIIVLLITAVFGPTPGPGHNALRVLELLARALSGLRGKE